jgi:hypothetical protein
MVVDHTYGLGRSGVGPTGLVSKEDVLGKSDFINKLNAPRD